MYPKYVLEENEDMLRFIFFSIFILSYNFVAYTQTIESFISSLGKADYATIESFLSEKLDLYVKDQQRYVPKSEAINTIKYFFADHSPKAIEPVHQGSSRQTGGGHYRLAKLDTSNGTFRVFIYYESEGKQVKVKELRFEKY